MINQSDLEKWKKITDAAKGTGTKLEEKIRFLGLAYTAMPLLIEEVERLKNADGMHMAMEESIGKKQEEIAGLRRALEEVVEHDCKDYMHKVAREVLETST